MKLITISFFVSILILTIGMAVAYSHLSKLNALIILHFNAASGPDYVGSSQDVFLIVLTGMGIALINFFLARALHLREQFLASMVSTGSIFISILILIAVLAIISNNT